MLAVCFLGIRAIPVIWQWTPKYLSTILLFFFYTFRVVGLWKEHLSRTNKKGADALADPEKYENLFPGMSESLVAEKYLAATEQTRPAAHYPLVTVSLQIRNSNPFVYIHDVF